MKRIKDDTSSNGKLLYAGEHLTCNHFLRDVGSGFTLQKVEKGQSMNSLLSPQYHNLLFFLNGMCTVSCNNYTNRNFCEGEMVLVPRFAKFSGKADTPLLVLIMAFNQPQSGCDRLVLQNYHVLCHEMLYDFHPLDIRPPLNQFIELLCFYLKSGMNCAHLHEMKHKELFFCLRGFYTKEEIAALFYPLIGKSLDFRELVYMLQGKKNSVREMAKQCGMSQNTFLRKFKEEFHETYHQWKSSQLCQRIVADIAEPNITLKELMSRHGFYSAANFNRFCKTNFGCTPTELMTRHRNISDG